MGSIVRRSLKSDGFFLPDGPYRSPRIEADQPTAPLNWMQRLKRVFAMPQGTLS